MKKIITILIGLAISVTLKAQCTPATATVETIEPGCDGNSGQLIVHATGGTGPYQYGMGGWSTQSDSVFSGLSAGTYNIRIVTADNCETWVNGVVLNYAPMDFASSVVNQTCWDYVHGQVNIIPSNGLAPYEYSNDGGATYTSNSIYQNLDVGTYNFKVRDANGCVKDVSFTITKSHIGPSVTTTPVQCSGILGTANVVFTGTDNYTFSIDYNASVQNGSGFYNYTQLQSGNYLLQCTDINGCNESVSFTIGDENIQSSVTNIVQETCNESNASFVISTSNGVGPYQYSIDGGLSFVNTDTFTGMDEGEYPTKVIDSRGCESADTVVITNTGGVVAEINADTSICNGDEAYLYVNATGQGLTYSWNNSLPDAPAHSVQPSTTTSYNVTVADVYNCTQTLSVNVTVENYPILNTSLSQVEMCLGDSVQVFVLGADRYIWSTGDTLPAIYITSPFGADSVDIHGYNGQCETVMTLPVTVHTIDAAITDTQHICQGSNADIFVNSVTPVIFEWNNGLQPIAHQVVSPSSDTDYEVVLSDSYGCKDTLRSSVLVDSPVNLVVNPTSVEVCEGEDVDLSVTGAREYLWADGQTDSVITYTANANEMLNISGYNGECNQSLSIPITVLPKPTVEIEANATSINTGESIQFGIGNSNASSYTWYFGDGYSSNAPIPLHQFSFTGAYNVILLGEKGVCANSDTLLIYVGTVGIDEQTNNTIKMYPVPVNNMLTIEFPSAGKDAKMTIFDQQGKIIQQVQLTAKTQIDVSSLSSGVYNIVIQDAGLGRIVKKLVKD